jgi:hypothetical protein
VVACKPLRGRGGRALPAGSGTVHRGTAKWLTVRAPPEPCVLDLRRRLRHASGPWYTFKRRHGEAALCRRALEHLHASACWVNVGRKPRPRPQGVHALVGSGGGAKGIREFAHRCRAGDLCRGPSCQCGRRWCWQRLLCSWQWRVLCRGPMHPPRCSSMLWL